MDNVYIDIYSFPLVFVSFFFNFLTQLSFFLFPHSHHHTLRFSVRKQNLFSLRWTLGCGSITDTKAWTKVEKCNVWLHIQTSRIIFLMHDMILWLEAKQILIKNSRWKTILIVLNWNKATHKQSQNSLDNSVKQFWKVGISRIP